MGLTSTTSPRRTRESAAVGFMNHEESKEFVEHLLDMVEAIPHSASGETVLTWTPDQAAEFQIRSAMRTHLLLLSAVARPDAVRKRPNLWDTAKDLLNAIESGALPKPNWYDPAVARRAKNG